jgi:hypothetical protein
VPAALAVLALARRPAPGEQAADRPTASGGRG